MTNTYIDKLLIAGIIEESVVDGTGIRLAVFVQGCHNECPGCHNPQTWDMNKGKLIGIKDIEAMYKNNTLLDGITFSGGEPFLQPVPLTMLAKKIHKLGGNVWCYTGYTYENLINIPDNSIHDLLANIDVLVDGPFIESQKDLELKFRGSKNQRILRLKDGIIASQDQ